MTLRETFNEIRQILRSASFVIYQATSILAVNADDAARSILHIALLEIRQSLDPLEATLIQVFKGGPLPGSLPSPRYRQQIVKPRSSPNILSRTSGPEAMPV